jgi:hypothetical protein
VFAGSPDASLSWMPREADTEDLEEKGHDRGEAT